MTRAAKLSPDQHTDIVRRYLAGESVRAIACTLGCVTHGAVCSLIRRRGIRRCGACPRARAHPRRPPDRTSSGIPITYDAFGFPIPRFDWLERDAPADMPAR